MKKKMILGLALLVALLPSMLAHASDSKVGYVNVKSAIGNTKHFKEGQKALKAWSIKKQKEISKYAKKMQKLDNEIKTQGMALSIESREQKIRELKSLEKIAKRKLQDIQEEGTAKEERLWLESSRNFKNKIKDFGKKSGYDIILSHSAVLYGKPSDDLTAAFTKLLNQK